MGFGDERADGGDRSRYVPVGYTDTTPYQSMKFDAAENLWATLDAAETMHLLLHKLGVVIEDSDHLKRTPERFVNMMLEMLTPEQFEFTTFPSTSDEMVTLGPIPFYTLCAHHLVPFFGNAWVGYVPNELVAGLSKIPRMIKQQAKGLWVQEELTGAVADAFEAELMPKGIAVVLKAEHLCMAMRGVKQPGVLTTTSAMRGVYNEHDRTAKAEFMEWIRNG